MQNVLYSTIKQKNLFKKNYFSLHVFCGFIIDFKNQTILCAKKKEAKQALHKNAKNSSTISYSPKSRNVLLIYQIYFNFEYL